MQPLNDSNRKQVNKNNIYLKEFHQTARLAAKAVEVGVDSVW